MPGLRLRDSYLGVALGKLSHLENLPQRLPIIGAAGNPLISQLVIRSGNVLDAIQMTNAGMYAQIPVAYKLPQHGGNGGNPSTAHG